MSLVDACSHSDIMDMISSMSLEERTEQISWNSFCLLFKLKYTNNIVLEFDKNHHIQFIVKSCGSVTNATIKNLSLLSIVKITFLLPSTQ
jgi:hypothetical protein